MLPLLCPFYFCPLGKSEFFLEHRMTEDALPSPDEAIWLNASALYHFACLGEVHKGNIMVHFQDFVITSFQPDAHLLDRDGGKHPIHSMLLRLKYPVFQNLPEFHSVTLDKVSASAVRLMVDIAYGTDRYLTNLSSLGTFFLLQAV